MADVAVVAASVSLTSGPATVEQVTYGGTVTQGQALYEDAADGNKYKPADADLSQTAAAVKAIALTPGSTGEKGYVIKRGVVDLGVNLTIGARYYASGTAGGIAPEADLATGDWVVLIGIAKALRELDVQIYNPGVQVP